ncbi:MAG: hypothetical protein C4527_05325 [Candidatus Omnitrophota bacterium]|nr:MAG: hypothetical protein C4527_05325 [Candidatus Omnitrophota bacterium]
MSNGVIQLKKSRIDALMKNRLFHGWEKNFTQISGLSAHRRVRFSVVDSHEKHYIEKYVRKLNDS